MYTYLTTVLLFPLPVYHTGHSGSPWMPNSSDIQNYLVHWEEEGMKHRMKCNYCGCSFCFIGAAWPVIIPLHLLQKLPEVQLVHNAATGKNTSPGKNNPAIKVAWTNNWQFNNVLLLQGHHIMMEHLPSYIPKLSVLFCALTEMVCCRTKAL